MQEVIQDKTGSVWVVRCGVAVMMKWRGFALPGSPGCEEPDCLCKAADGKLTNREAAA